MIKPIACCLLILALVGCTGAGDGKYSTQFIGHWTPVDGLSDSTTYVKILYNKVAYNKEKLLFYFEDGARGTAYNLYPDFLSKGKMVFKDHFESIPSVDSAVIHENNLIVYTSEKRFEFQRR